MVKWLIVVGCGLGISAIPLPAGVTRESWTLLSIFIATIVGSIVQPMPGSAMVLLGVVAVTVFRALPIEKALSGYADRYVWLVLAAFFISRAMIKTGLGHRIALIFRSHDRPENAGSRLFAGIYRFHPRFIHPLDRGPLRRHHPAHRPERLRNLRFAAGRRHRRDGWAHS